MLAYGTMVHVALAAAEDAGIDAEVIDLRTLLPVDIDAIVASVAKTGPLRHRARSHPHLRLWRRTLRRWCRSIASISLKRRSSASPAIDTPYPHALEWEYFPTPPRIIKAMRRVMEA